MLLKTSSKAWSFVKMLGAGFLWLALRIPIVQCVFYFPAASHKKAAQKFVFLLIATSFPILAAALLTSIPPGEDSISSKLGRKISETVTISELFVYATSFLTPYLFLVFERYRAVRQRFLRGAAETKEKLDIFPGYFLVLALAFLLIIATAIAFGLMKSDSLTFADSFLFHGFKNYAGLIYFFGLYCWYLTLLDEAHDPAAYGAELGNSSANVTDGLAARLAQRG